MLKLFMLSTVNPLKHFYMFLVTCHNKICAVKIAHFTICKGSFTV